MLVVFTDVDGTLIDHDSYSVEPAREALAQLQGRGIPVVLCSSKTRAEVERLQEDLGTAHPFVIENGGAVFVPHRYFPFPIPGARHLPVYDVIELGRPYEEVVAALRTASERSGVTVIGFNDMSVAEVARDTGLSLADARLAKLREYDEPFRLAEPGDAALTRLVRAMAGAGLRHSAGGRYHHASGHTDKGVAVNALRRLFTRAHGEILTVGLGDGLNDVPLLREVQIPVVVSNAAAGATDQVAQRVAGARVTVEGGPRGWRQAIAELLEP
jgi:mannosyl-3-phosphoglycerate phosphatase